MSTDTPDMAARPDPTTDDFLEEYEEYVHLSELALFAAGDLAPKAKPDRTYGHPMTFVVK